MLRRPARTGPAQPGRTRGHPVKKHAWRWSIHAHSQFENRSRRKVTMVGHDPTIIVDRSEIRKACRQRMTREKALGEMKD
jgi:hypothetical protein